jgi:hypothetical protein
MIAHFFFRYGSTLSNPRPQCGRGLDKVEYEWCVDLKIRIHHQQRHREAGRQLFCVSKV